MKARNEEKAAVLYDFLDSSRSLKGLCAGKTVLL